MDPIASWRSAAHLELFFLKVSAHRSATLNWAPVRTCECCNHIT